MQNNSKGFIQIPLLIAIIVGVLVIGGGGYFGVEQYKNYQQQKIGLQEVQKNLQKENNNNPDISSIIAQWRSRIVYIECEFRYADGTLYGTSAGSGMAGGAVNFTNRHILVDENGYGPSACYIKYPDNDTNYKVMNNPLKMWASKKYDEATLILDINDNIKNLNSSEWNRCLYKASIGDEIIILGYPSIGSQSDITATRGIISGYDGDYYITDAKIEHGNSGGVAILLKDNCYLGIPSFTVAGEVESLARILDSRVIFDTNFNSNE